MRHFSLQAPIFLLTLPVALLLTGCGMGVSTPVAVEAPNEAFHGAVIGGQNPISGATISVYAYGASGYGSAATLLASTTTNATGGFNFASGAYTCPTSSTPVYILSIGGDSGSGVNPNAVLGAALGTCAHAQSSFLILNEVSTVGLAYALSQYFNTTLGGTAPANDNFGGPAGSLGLANANSYTAALLAQLSTGYATPSSGNMTTEDTKVYTIADMLAACVNSPGQTSSTDTSSGCGRLFNYTTPPTGGTRPSDTLQAAVMMALYPTQNVNHLFLLLNPRVPFPNDLSTQPDDLSIAVKFTGSGLGLGVDTNTLSTIDIDSAGRVWFPSTASGGTGVAYFDPASSTFNGPYNGTGMTHPNQVAIDGSGYVWVSDTQGAEISGYNTSSPTAYSSLSLAGTNSYSITIGHDTQVDVGLLDSGLNKYKLANVSTNRQTYSEQSTGLLSGYAPISLAGDASGDTLIGLSSPTKAAIHHYYQAAGSTSVTQKSSASDGMGTSAFTGGDLIGARAYIPSGTNGSLGSSDAICFAIDAACYPIQQPNQNGITGIAVDGAKTIWIASGNNATVNAAPMLSPSGTGTSASYLSSNSNIATVTLTHDSDNGNTLIAPAGIAIDNSGNVWVSNAGCTTTGCTPGSFVLTEIIGAAAPTITPVSAQITGSNLAGTEP